MALVQVMPMIGQVKKERMYSLSGCHAIYEKTVSKACDSDTVGKAIADAVYEILLSEARDSAVRSVSEVQFIVRFRV
jgi:hypothetical protein